MSNNRALKYCLTKVSRRVRDGDARNASRCLCRYIEEQVAIRDMSAIDRLLVQCRDKKVPLKEINKVSLLRSCFRLRESLREYQSCLDLWRQDLKAAGMDNLLIGL
ncbi:hypothetical protein AH06_271 [Erwinia phage AH06]|nr:hypothetical protein AH06_271 [Erwinia phage AH06]